VLGVKKGKAPFTVLTSQALQHISGASAAQWLITHVKLCRRSPISSKVSFL